MAISSKRFRRLRNLIHYGIAFFFCVFLVLLTNRIITDLAKFSNRPQLVDYQNQLSDTLLLNRIDSIQRNINNTQNNLNILNNTLEAATTQSNLEKEAYNTWLKTRRTIGSPDQDLALVRRNQKLDSLYAIQQGWAQQIKERERSIIQNRELLASLEEERILNQEQANQAYQKAYRSFELRAFLTRLAIVLPFLVIGIYFLMRYRNHRFWPLFIGFTWFAFYSFFFGVVPYLPWYGGYVRYTVGIISSIFLGIYAIRAIRQYAEKQQSLSTQKEIAKAINQKQELVEKSFEKHLCPSCGKDFLPPKWLENGSRNPNVDFSRFCKHCGLNLFKSCQNCESLSFAHFPFCGVCGHDLNPAD